MLNIKNLPLSIRPSQLALALLMLKGKPLNLEDYTPFKYVYDVKADEMVLMCGRQIGKSVSLAALITSHSILRKHFTTLFVSPLSQQTSRFSSQYLTPFLNSKIIKKHFVNSSQKKNVFEKELNNGARIFLGYAETEMDADRIRGISADCFFYDEAQDASIEIFPIIKETLSASDHKLRRYTGTAKGESNTLTLLYNKSNMSEWAVKCSHCGKYTIPNDHETCLKIMKNPDGPGCAHCGKLINMKEGIWVAARPDVNERLGFHIPQICIPARNTKKQWSELRLKIYGEDPYSAVKLSNEVFGLPVGAGGRPLSMREALSCCNPNRVGFEKEFPKDERGILYTTLGVDWSVTGSDKSYTVISILGYDMRGKTYLLYSERLDGIDILDQVRHVHHLYYKFSCSAMGSDRGVGVLQGQLLQQDLGKDKVHIINYVAAKQTLRWDKQGQFFAAARTQNIDTFLLKAKLGKDKFETPSWETMAQFWKDALCLYEEESHSGQRLIRKDADQTDDWTHSVVFANVANMVLRNEFVYTESEVLHQDSIFDL